MLTMTRMVCPPGAAFDQPGQRAREAMEIGQLVPFDQPLDIFLHPAAEQRHEPERLAALARVGVKPVQRLQPDQRELDRVLARVRLGRKMPSQIGPDRQRLDQVDRAFRRAQRRDVAAPVKVPFQNGPMPHTEHDVGIGQWDIEQRTKRRGIGAQAHAKVDMRRDDAEQFALLRGRRSRTVRLEGSESVSEKSERLGRVGRITIGMMIGKERSHEALLK